MQQREKNSVFGLSCVLCTEGVNFLYGTFTADVLFQIMMVVASRTYGGEEKCVQGFGGPT